MTNIKDQKLFYTIQTSLLEYNEHATNIVALKNLIILNKGSIPESDYNTMLELMRSIYGIDKKIWDDIKKQGIEHVMKTQGVTESEAAQAIV